MFRTTDIVLIAAMLAAAGFTYITKHAAEAEYAKVRKLEAAIRFEEDTIDILKADWSLLTQPSRLQKLATTYQSELKLVPLDSYQVGEIEDLPMRSLRIEDVLKDAIAGAPIDGIDGTTTGGVAQ